MVYKVKVLLIALLGFMANNGLSQETDHSIFGFVDSLIYKDVSQAKEKLQLIESESLNNYNKGQLLKRKAILARIEGKYNHALEYNLSSLDIFVTAKDTIEIAEIYHNLGYLMRYMEDYPLALSYYEQAILLRAQIKDSTALAISHREIGVIYRKNKNYSKTQYHYDQAQKLFDPINDKEEIITLQGNYASLYHIQREYNLAIQINKEALKTIRLLDKPKSMSTRYGNIAMAYYRMKEYESANTYIDSALSVSFQANLLESEVRHTLRKAKIVNKQKNYKSAYKIMLKYDELSDSLSLLSTAQIAENQIKAFNRKNDLLKDSIDLAMREERLEASVTLEKAERKKKIWIALFIMLTMASLLLWQFIRIKMSKLQIQNEKLSADLLQRKLNYTQKENERLLDHTQLQTAFKKSIIEKIDNENLNTPSNIRDIKQDLLEQLRIDNQSQAINKSIDDLPSTFDGFLRREYQSLTKGERKVCFLVRSGLTIKEIARINESSFTAVQSMRYRIRKKLNLKRNEELQTFLLDNFK